MLLQFVIHSIRSVTTENGASERRSLQDAVESLCARTGASPDTNYFTGQPAEYKFVIKGMNDMKRCCNCVMKSN